MKSSTYTASVLGLIIMFWTPLHAQKDIDLGDSLSLGAEKMKVKMGTMNNDTSDVWVLLLNELAGTGKANEDTQILTNRMRRISVKPLYSSVEGKQKRGLPAMGYKLTEDHRYISAVQYYGGGLMGQNRSVVWFRRDLDNPFKLMLAAAMTAILQVRIGNPNMRD
jgi:hypothetical protein